MLTLQKSNLLLNGCSQVSGSALMLNFIESVVAGHSLSREWQVVL